MPDDNGLLAYIARRYIGGREDVATDALAFILNRCDGVRSPGGGATCGVWTAVAAESDGSR